MGQESIPAVGYYAGRRIPMSAHFLNNISASLIVLALLVATLTQSGCGGVSSANINPTNSNTLPASSLVISPSSINFGDVPAGSSQQKNLTLTNSGTVPVTVSSFIVSGAGFSIAGPFQVMTLTAGQGMSLTVSFQPTVLDSASGTIAITTTESSSPTTITINGAGVAVAPSITLQPASQTVIAGQTASFSVAATGTAPLSYQWMKSGSANRRSNFLKLHDSGYNHSRQRLTVLYYRQQFGR